MVKTPPAMALLAGVSLLLLLLPGCSQLALATPAPAAGSCLLGLPDTATPEDAIRRVLSAEGELVVRQEIGQLMDLWTDGSTVVNAKNTADPQDDQFWLDKDAIRHRYVRTVFPGAPKEVTPADLRIALQDDHAVVTATTQIGSEISPAGDRWELVKRNDCWLIQGLVYNLEPTAP